ncbi:uncharacterized protein LOC142237685 [Haematobia irritans]|uniref:uncharacterized protein LOC142237685 n=1 Tax=Haematobia irritans TaxID=7368 RepID=UPI003F4F850D
MSDDTTRRTFQRDRTFAKFESNSKRWSAIGYSSNDVSISNTDNTMNSDFKTNMAISITNLPEYSEETEYNENYPGKFQPQFKTSRNRFASTPLLLQDTIHDEQESPVTPEPALLGVKQKLILFEKLNSNEYITIIPPKLKPKNYERKFITQWHLGHHRQTMAEALTNDSKIENSVSSPKQIVADEVVTTKIENIGITENSEYKTKEIKSNIAYIASYNSEPTLESEASQNGYTDEEKDPTTPETQNRQIKGSELIFNSNETKTKSKEMHDIADVVEAVLENKFWIKSSDKSVVREHSSSSIEKRDRSNLDLRFNEDKSATNKSFLSPEFMKFVGLHNDDMKEDERNLIDNEERVKSNSKSDVILSSPLEEDNNDADVEDNTQDTWNAKETVVDVNNCLQHYSSNKEDILNVKSKPSNYKIFEDLEALLKPKNEDITSEKNIKILNTNDLEGVMLKPKSKELSRSEIVRRNCNKGAHFNHSRPSERSKTQESHYSLSRSKPDIKNPNEYDIKRLHSYNGGEGAPVLIASDQYMNHGASRSDLIQMWLTLHLSLKQELQAMFL